VSNILFEKKALKVEKKILTIIPARAGSKRVPFKNIKILGDKPLIAWTIELAKHADLMPILVSTDSEEIYQKSKDLGVTSYMRSPSFATDSASVIDVVIEGLKFYKNQGESFDGVLLLQPTSPFRTLDSIKKAISLFNLGGGESVVSVSRAKTHPYWCKSINKGMLLPFDGSYGTLPERSQDLPDVYGLNGLIYLATVEVILNRKSFYSINTQALVIESEEESLDIDTPFDWLVAEAIANSQVEVV
jgi:CMP-N-acetylneuraminic acid synthetase